MQNPLSLRIISRRRTLSLLFIAFFAIMFCRESQAALIFTFSDAGGGQTRMEASGSIDLDAPDFGPSTTFFPQAGTRFAFQQNGSNPSVGLSSFDLTAGGNDFFFVV